MNGKEGSEQRKRGVGGRRGATTVRAVNKKSTSRSKKKKLEGHGLREEKGTGQNNDYTL